MIEIHTERLVIRLLKIEDITEEYIFNLNDKEVNRFISAGRKNQTYEDVKGHIENYTGRFLGIFLKGKHIGNMSLRLDGTVGIMIFKKFQRKGYAQESLEAAKFFGFDKAGINIHNQVSLALFKKSGFYIKKHLG